jgi:hypothetical protein
MQKILLAGFVLGLLSGSMATSALAKTPSGGCGTPGLTSGTYTIQRGGLTRTFRVHVPTG